MPITDYTPTLIQVAAKVRARVKDGYGNVVGTFAPYEQADERNRTRPTAEQVTALITDAVDEVAAAVGPDVPDGPDPDDPGTLRRMARSVAVTLAAISVESQFFPEQIASDRSNLTQLERELKRKFDRLIEAVAEAGPGGGGGSVGGNATMPNYDFPETETTTVGFRTNF